MTPAKRYAPDPPAPGTVALDDLIAASRAAESRRRTWATSGPLAVAAKVLAKKPQARPSRAQRMRFQTPMPAVGPEVGGGA